MNETSESVIEINENHKQSSKIMNVMKLINVDGSLNADMLNEGDTKLLGGERTFGHDEQIVAGSNGLLQLITLAGSSAATALRAIEKTGSDPRAEQRNIGTEEEWLKLRKYLLDNMDMFEQKFNWDNNEVESINEQIAILDEYFEKLSS